MALAQDKASLRRRALARRRARDASSCLADARSLVFTLSPLLASARCVAAYLPVHGEVDPRPLLASLDAQVVFPRCEGRALVFAHASPHDPAAWRRGAMGLLEPTAPAAPLSLIDRLLVPAVACDRRGVRLGYGGGFYDRLLASFPALIPLAIAVIDADGLVEALPSDPWDIPLPLIATPRATLDALRDDDRPQRRASSGSSITQGDTGV